MKHYKGREYFYLICETSPPPPLPHLPAQAGKKSKEEVCWLESNGNDQAIMAWNSSLHIMTEITRK